MPNAGRCSRVRGREGGGRIFPETLTPRTAPRLWAAIEKACEIQDLAYNNFAKLAGLGLHFVFSVPPFPAGIAGDAVPMAERIIVHRSPRFRDIPYGQSIDSLGRAIAGRVSEGVAQAKLLGAWVSNPNCGFRR